MIFFLTLHRCFGSSPPISTPAAPQSGYAWIHNGHWDCESRPFQIPEAIIMWHVRNKPFCNWTSLVAQTVKRLSTMRETWVWSLGREDPLEKEMAFHSSTIAWKIPWTEEPDRLQSMGSERVGHDWATSLSLSLSFCNSGVVLQSNFLPCLNKPEISTSWSFSF